jgi:hypothetical protein
LLLKLAAVEWSSVEIFASEMAERLNLLGGLKWLGGKNCRAPGMAWWLKLTGG